MEKLIACCGIDCATCDARTATINNDNELREKTAEKWRVQFNSPEISLETINCTGCREAGVKFAHCLECEIRNCVKSKGFNTCGDCKELDNCAIVGNLLQYVPEGKANLKLAAKSL
jgi:hypothetical protein